MNKLICVKWHCGYYVGESKWQDLETYEPDECGTEFETEHEQEEWDEQLCSTECPNCQNELTQKFDSPELVTDPTS